MFFFSQQIVGYPSTKVLTSEEKDLVWQFRFYLTNQKKVNLQCDYFFLFIKIEILLFVMLLRLYLG